MYPVIPGKGSNLVQTDFLVSKALYKKMRHHNYDNIFKFFNMGFRIAIKVSFQRTWGGGEKVISSYKSKKLIKDVMDKKKKKKNITT